MSAPTKPKLSEATETSPSCAVDQQSKAPASNLRKWGRWSTTFVAFVVFVLVNVAIALPHVLKTKRVLNPGNGVQECLDSAMAEYQTTTAKTVVMGSSVVTSALWCSDDASRQHVPDFFHDHHAYALDDQLKRLGVQKGDIFSFAVPGAMVSDVYLINRKIFVGNKIPHLIIYGIAPRDFVDDTLSSETRTPVFERIAETSDLIGGSKLYVSSMYETMDFTLARLFFLYGRRIHEQDKMAAIWSHAVHQDVRQPTPELPSIATRGADAKTLWAKSEAEYKQRYSHFNAAQFDKQTKFLSASLSDARAKNISVVLVDMPLTKLNRSLMPSGFEQRYKRMLATTAQQFGAPVYDPTSGGIYKFDDSMFLDTVHLNAKGGKLLSAAIADWIAQNPQVSK